MAIKPKLNNKGIALILAVMLMTLVLILSLYFLNFSLSEMQISNSQITGEKAYYLAESGIAEMIWKLKNDPAYQNDFQTNPSWTTSFTRTDPFGPNSGSYTVSIANTDLASGDIVSTGNVNINGRIGQRVIKTKAFKALGVNISTGNNASYANGNINISFSEVNFHTGGIQSNGNIIINGGSTVNIEGDVNATGNFLVQDISTASTSGAIHAANHPPAAAQVPMPAIDFDSNASTSYENRATAVYTSSQFDNLMQNNQNLTLNNPITFVNGNVELKGGQTLTLNGLLVVDKDFIDGHSLCRGFRCGTNNLIVNYASGTPAGILAKGKVDFELWTGNVNANGVIYADDQLNIISLPLGGNFTEVGGLISRMLTITSVWQPINITFNSNYLSDILGSTTFSPTITVEHWEEEY